MQFTVDTRNATAFELNALAEFVQKLAEKTPERIFAFASLGEAPGACERAEQAVAEVLMGNAPAHPASGAPELPTGAGPVPEIPPAPGSTPPAVAAAPESTNPTDVPAAPTSVPAVPASTSAAAPVGGQVELDSAGCPWSPLIHTSNKATIGDGTWRKKPGVDPAYFESVKAELMGNAPAAPSVTVAATSDVPTAPGSDSAPVPPSVPVAETPAAPATPAPALLTGNDVMARAMEIQMADGTKSAALFQAIQGAGIPAGPMGLPGCTDQGVLAAALAAVNAVGAQ
ncbi:MAG: hypothetical protein RSE94_02120 [Pseudomonas sp.]